MFDMTGRPACFDLLKLVPSKSVPIVPKRGDQGNGNLRYGTPENFCTECKCGISVNREICDNCAGLIMARSRRKAAEMRVTEKRDEYGPGPIRTWQWADGVGKDITESDAQTRRDIQYAGATEGQIINYSGVNIADPSAEMFMGPVFKEIGNLVCAHDITKKPEGSCVGRTCIDCLNEAMVNNYCCAACAESREKHAKNDAARYRQSY